MNKTLLVFGTRPELIKLAPVIKEFSLRGMREKLFIVYTNQHSNYVNQDIDYFNILIDYQFDLKREGDSLSLLNGLLLLEFEVMFKKVKSNGIFFSTLIVQGDTCSTFAAAQFAFYERIPVLHIEAGLRTFDFNEPFPEEYYRKSISSFAQVNFAPTILAQKNLLNEGVNPSSIVVCGNTSIDNLCNLKLTIDDETKTKLILITIHRRENMKKRIEIIINRIIKMVENNPSKSFVWIDNPGYKLISKLNSRPKNLQVIQPLAFSEMIKFYEKTELIITDSGGIQEEAAFLGIPVILFRKQTERIEGNLSGISKYFEDGDEHLETLITQLKEKEIPQFNPIYGDGKAAMRIVDFLKVNNYI
jgi:UDP-N-acetylglucosamine 2-epimerase (non-hydrolysing)